MIDIKNLPDNDPELILAKQYGKVMAGEQEITDIRNPVFNILVEARNTSDQSEAKIPLGDSEIAWDGIKRALTGNESRNTSNILPLLLTKKWYWAAAAVILITLTAMFLIRQFMGPDAQLLAESGTSISVVVLADGSTATLRPNSKLYKLVSTDQQQSYLLNGEALFEVESRPDRTLTVEAGRGRVVVTGTRFNLTDRDERSTVYLLEGSVIFETADRTSSVRLKAGEAVALNRDYVLEDLFEFEPDVITGWTQNRLIFRDRQVADILSELEFHFNISIQVPDEIRQITLGGSIALESPVQSLQDLGIVLGGEFIPANDQIYQFRIHP